MMLAQDFWENEWLDKWTIPFGQWIEDIVFWLTGNVKWLFDGIEKPIDVLLEIVADNLLRQAPWPIILVAFFLLGAVTRNLKVGLGAAAALLTCGLLGDEYWDLTMETVGMIIVSVLICAIIGIPLGIFAARVDSFWNRLRPILDGMQVIHPFVYILPVIFLFGIRRTPGVLATLVFALPPIIRLTNLGIRQVPGDVVEAARAFGASELRVLKEVQIPLARPAIMAGLNQTLLLSLSMVGIVAIIAGGGLGEPILSALNTTDIPGGASAGLALYFVGVLLDRISQPEAGDKSGNLFSKMQTAWASRKDPIVPPLPTFDQDQVDLISASSPVELSLGHKLAAQAAVIGGGATIFGSMLAWANDAGRISPYVRIADAQLPGAHSGVSAVGGSWFGIAALIVGLVIVLIGLVTLAIPASLSSNATKLPTFVAAGVAVVALVGSYLAVPAVSTHSNGIGTWFTLAGGAIILLPAMFATFRIEAKPRRFRLEPGSSGALAAGRRSVVMVALAAFLIFAGASGAWILDQRNDAAAIVAELAAQADDEANQGGAAAEILAEAMSATRKISIQGTDAAGPRIGYAIVALTAMAMFLSAARYVSPGQIQRLLSYLLYGLGAGIIAVSIAWIATIVRLDITQLTPGAGAFLTGCGGALLMTIARGQIAAHEAAASIRPQPDQNEVDNLGDTSPDQVLNPVSS